MNLIKEKMVELCQREKFMKKFQIFILVYCIIMLILIWAIPNIKGIIFNTFFILGLVAFLNYDFLVVLEKSIRGKQEKISVKKIVLSSTKIIVEVFLVLSYIVYFILVDIFKEYILMLTIILIFSMALLGVIAYVISKKFKDSQK